jgi:hypothetical protein
MELFVDRCVVTVQANVRTGAVGIAFEDDVDIRRNAEKGSELYQNHHSAHNPI